MAELNPYIFRAYDVRGKVGIDITPPVFELVGRAYGTLVKRGGGRTVALGMDNRTSSAALKAAFATGVLSTGLDVVDIGVNHTPLLYFATAHWGLDGGATVTGSHNPVSDNGVKMVHAAAAPLSEDEIQGLLAIIRSGESERRYSPLRSWACFSGPPVRRTSVSGRGRAFASTAGLTGPVPGTAWIEIRSSSAATPTTRSENSLFIVTSQDRLN